MIATQLTKALGLALGLNLLGGHFNPELLAQSDATSSVACSDTTSWDATLVTDVRPF